MVGYVGHRDGGLVIDGFVRQGRELEPVTQAELATTTDGGDLPQSIRMSLSTATGTWRVTGQLSHALPLRNRRRHGDDDLVTRIVECAVHWSVDGTSEHQLLGLAEYLDQIVDGRPAGLTV
jgi:hypothetical protein